MHTGAHVDLTRPRYDQTTFYGRLRHFIDITNPINILATQQHLTDARDLVEQCKYVISVLL
jgi:hypothetical protein